MINPVLFFTWLRILDHPLHNPSLFQDFDLVEDADDELKLDDDNFEAELEEMLQQNKEEA